MVGMGTILAQGRGLARGSTMEPLRFPPESPMKETAVQSALTASALALVVAFACIAAFLPPMLAQTLGSIPRTALLGCAIAVAIPVHWAFLGIAARRMGRSVARWVGLAVLLFPVGGIAALILLGWLGDEGRHATVPVTGQ